jgi:carbonic anhydrase
MLFQSFAIAFLHDYTTHLGIQWGETFQTCQGPKQSPINIDTNNVIITPSRPFKFKGYDQIPTEAVLKNNGHSGNY